MCGASVAPFSSLYTLCGPLMTTDITVKTRTLSHGFSVILLQRQTKQNVKKH